jgi:hypothetical protein
MTDERIDLMIDEMTAGEFVLWLTERDIYIEGPGRGKGGLWFIKVRCLRTQAVYEGSSEGPTSAMALAIHALLEDRKKQGAHLKPVPPKYLT